jgi:hypothetical protein
LFWSFFLPLPWKLSIETIKRNFSRTLFVFCRFCILLAMFPSFALKIDLGNYQKELFLEPFSFFSVFFSFVHFFSCCFVSLCILVFFSFFPFMFHVHFVVFFWFWLFVLLCHQNWPWK